MSGIAELIECYRDAALQRHLMQPRIDDRKRIGEGWRLFHAVDSNVVGYYLDPLRHARKRPHLAIGLGDIFALDTIVAQQAIAVLVADYPFQSLDPGTPLLALSPISSEIRGLFEAHMASALGAGKPRMPDEELARQLNALDLDRLNLRDRDLIHQAIILQHLSTSTADRLFDLTRDVRIFGGDRANAKSHSAALADALRYAATTGEMIGFAQRKHQWLRRLAHVGRSNKPRDERDAEAMARLELCNERLRAGGVFERLLYITGDSMLIEASSYHTWEDDDGVSNFATSFLRHPRAYLDEPEVMRPLDREKELDGETLFGWLTVLLGRIDELAPDLVLRGGTIQFPGAVNDIIKQVADDDPNAAEKILERWRNFAAKVTQDPLAPKSHVSRLAELLNNDAIAAHLQDARSVVEQEIAERWTKVFYVSAGARLALESMMPTGTYEGPLEREVPRLVFEDRPKLSAFLRSGGRWLDQDLRFDHQRYEGMRKDVRDEDPSEYGDYIGHAYLLAQQAQWKTASILAGIASSRVRGIDRYDPEQSNGRESHYLEGYCARLASVDKADLENARLLVLKALRIQEEEGVVAAAEAYPYEIAVERFEAELLVIEAAEALYDWLDSKDALLLRARMLKVRRALAELAERTSTKLLLLDGQQLTATHDRDMIEQALRSVLGRCYRSGLGAGLIADDFGEETCMLWQRLQAWVDENPQPSQYMGFVLELGDLVFTDGLGTKQRRARLDVLERKAMPAAVQPFDQARYDQMIAHVRTRIASSQG